MSKDKVQEFEHVDASNQDEVAKALALLNRTREQSAKSRARLANDPEAKAKAALASKKRRVRDKLLMAKAMEQGITVTEEEIEAELSK